MVNVALEVLCLIPLIKLMASPSHPYSGARHMKEPPVTGEEERVQLL